VTVVLLVFTVAVQRRAAGLVSLAASLFLSATGTWCAALSTGEQYPENKKPIWFLVLHVVARSFSGIENQGRMGLGLCLATTLDGCNSIRVFIIPKNKLSK
jgi:hypothetical protein